MSNLPSDRTKEKGSLIGVGRKYLFLQSVIEHKAYEMASTAERKNK